MMRWKEIGLQALRDGVRPSKISLGDSSRGLSCCSFLARLKSCPFKTVAEAGSFRSCDCPEIRHVTVKSSPPVVPWGVAARLTGIFADTVRCTGTATRLRPLDWIMDSNKGFSPASGVRSGRQSVGREHFENRESAQEIWSRRDRKLSPEAWEFGQGGCGPVKSIFPQGKARFLG